MARAIVLVLDSLGIGASADAHCFGDTGADTLGHIAQACHAGRAPRRDRPGALYLPNLQRMGLLHAHADSTGKPVPGFDDTLAVDAAWGHAREISTGKDTPSGHWEMAGVPVTFEWGYFENRENSFPDELIDALVRHAALPGVLGNCHASGTEIIERLGREHVDSGKPIVYTSADSVFQVAAHERHFGLDRLYEVCTVARGLLEPYNIGRVIARPFDGDAATGYHRTGNRRDYSLAPPAPTVLDRLAEAGGEVIAVGKIADIYAHSGITQTIKANGNNALFDATLQAIKSASDQSLVMTNFVDFDMCFGHRRDIAGYAAALEAFDRRLPELLDLAGDDLVILSADHGCDPTWPGSDHTREHVPVLARGGGLKAGPLGQRETFADIGQSLASHFGIDALPHGASFIERQSA